MSRGSPQYALHQIDGATLLPAFGVRGRPPEASRAKVRSRSSQANASGKSRRLRQRKSGSQDLDSDQGQDAPSKQAVTRQVTPSENQVGTHRVASRHLGHPRTRTKVWPIIRTVLLCDHRRRRSTRLNTSTRIDVMTFGLSLSPKGRTQTHHPERRPSSKGYADGIGRSAWRDGARS